MKEAIDTGYVLVGDQEMFHRRGKLYADDDPIVLAAPHAFEDAKPHDPLSSFSEPGPIVESATAAPGERRQTGKH